MSDSRFNPGDVVNLRSGGPLLTIDSIVPPAYVGNSVSTTSYVSATYYNSVSGLFEKLNGIDQRCLRDGVGKPEIPSDAAQLRATSVTKKIL